MEIENTKNFHIADFVAWNNRNWDMYRYYHAPDVVVDMGGLHTEGIEPHIDAMRRTMDEYGDAKVVQHDPCVAEGEWTAAVGTVPALGFRLATVVKWRDGRICEEYVFTSEITVAEAESAALPQPAISFTSPDDAELWAAVGVEPGWTCSVHGSAAGNRSVVFTKRTGGEVVERIAFAEL